MKRKDFLSSVVPFGALVTSFVKEDDTLIHRNKTIQPPFLQAEDTVAISSPAGYISLEDIQPAIQKLTEWGFKIKIGDTIGKKDNSFGGTDVERKNDLQQLLDNKEIKAILCARGGYGTMRIIDQLDFKLFKRNPKWVIGFSDITLLHCHINSNFRIASIHSKMCNSFPKDWNNADAIQKETIQSIYDVLIGTTINISFLPNSKNRKGTIQGELIGGNLRTIESILATKSDINTTNKILFIEDTGEYLYGIDRMLLHLKRSKKLSKLKGLVVGGFKIKKDDEGEEFGKTLEEIILEHVSEYNFPVCFDFPTGHQKNNLALKCGANYQLTIHENECSLTEIQ